MTDLPPLNALRAFEAAGRHLNFRGAADELGVTQGAVAQQVRGLEEHLGLPLFERLPKGLAFTVVGRGYHARILEAFAILREASAVLRPEAAQVLISVTPTFAAKWLIPHLPGFTDRYPEIDLRILATEKVSSFHADGIDLAVRLGNPPFGAALEAHLLFHQEIVAVAAPGLLSGYGDQLDNAALASMPKLHDSHDLWPAFLKQCGIAQSRSRDIRLSQTTLAIDAALAGQGVALASRFLVSADLDAGRLMQAAPQTLNGQGDFFLLARRGTKRTEAAGVTFRWLVETAHK
ncbi:LysR substrate-binding domain-containing protein [Pseudotabrizicola sp. L79]|uniref:LysR substrate-binding domain-containing protein n=1 Tax=Pseudotabrizicola sp. L79 TaxID=3118402 RepID=UPI002F94C536